MIVKSDEVTIAKRNLPHWQIGGSVYFITFRSARGILPTIALNEVKKHILFDHNKRYRLYFAVIMPDHVHILLQPLKNVQDKFFTLKEILQGIKGSSARSINKVLQTSGTVWQAESFDRIMRNEEEMYEKWNYMWNNPIKAGLATGLEEYEFYVKPE